MAHSRQCRSVRVGALRICEAAGISLGDFPCGSGPRSADRIWRLPRPACVAGSARRIRNQLRRLIVTQGDTEPASVEQQRWLGQRCPSMYDLRNLFQVNVEEGRHLWAMVYLLHRYFGRDGRDEAEELLARQSGNRDKPRILDAFNEPIENWLDFFMFTMLTDRDGKPAAVAFRRSFIAFAHDALHADGRGASHVRGETDIARIVERTCQLRARAGYSEDVRRLGGIDLL